MAVGLFAFVHILYTTTFGFKPLRMLLGILVYTLMVGVASYVLPKIGQMELKMVFPIYMFLIHTMLWRALAKLNLSSLIHIGFGACASQFKLVVLIAFRFQASSTCLNAPVRCCLFVLLRF